MNKRVHKCVRCDKSVGSITLRGEVHESVGISEVGDGSRRRTPTTEHGRQEVCRKTKEEASGWGLERRQ